MTFIESFETLLGLKSVQDNLLESSVELLCNLLGNNGMLPTAIYEQAGSVILENREESTVRRIEVFEPGKGILKITKTYNDYETSECSSFEW